jgi:putative pyruvate formate lyase activating enzyme
MAWILGSEGCHNINWVGGDPTIHLHAIVDSISLLGEPDYRPEEDALAAALRVKSDGAFDFSAVAAGGGPFNTPMLWNSNFIMTAETMKILRLLMDVWLPDFKFGPGRCALDLARTPWYWQTATENLFLLRDWGEDFTIRHLVMPNHVECCTFPVLDWIADNMPDAIVNIMDQFRPDTFTNPRSPLYRDRYADVSRRLMVDEIRAAFAHGKERGIRFEAITFEKDISRFGL